jgi:hypothetical protein
VFDQWLPFLSSVFASATLRVYSSFNAGVFGRIEQSAVYAGTSFFISPTLFLQSIHYSHLNLKRVYIVKLFIQSIQRNCGYNRLRAGVENQIEPYRMRFCLWCGSN